MAIEKQTKAVATRQPNPNFQVMKLTEIQDLAAVFIASGIFADTKDAAQAVVKILAGQEVGLLPFYSMNNFFLIEAFDKAKDKMVVNIGQSAQSMSALLVRDGDYRYTIKEDTAERCVIEYEQLFSDGWKWVYTGTFTNEDADKAGLLHRWDDKTKQRVLKTSGTWYKWKKDMLYNRCQSRSCRRIGSHKLGGARYTPEELSSGILEIPEAISPSKILEIEPAPHPNEKKAKSKGKGKGKKDRSAENSDVAPEGVAEVGDAQELTGAAEEAANQAFDAMAKKEAAKVDTKTGEVVDSKKTSLAEGTPAMEGEITNKEENYHEIKPEKKTAAPPLDAIPDPPRDPASVNTYMKMLNVAYADMALQPKDAYSILGGSNTSELEKKHTPEKAYLVLWKHYYETKKRGGAK